MSLQRMVSIQMSVAILCFGIGSRAFSQGETCGAATAIGSGAYFGSTATALPSFTVDCGNVSTSNDVWYSYTPNAFGQATIHTAGSSFDTFLTIFSDCSGSPASIILCNDDAGGPTTLGTNASEVALGTLPGVTYLIRIGGFNNASGDYRLSIIEVVPSLESLCAPVREFPSIGSAITAEPDPFFSSTETGILSSAALDHKISQIFYFTDRPVVFEAVLDLYIFNYLVNGNFIDLDVKVNGSQVGGFRVTTGEPSGRRQVLVTFSGQTTFVTVEIAVNNNVVTGGGGISFGYAGEHASHIELHGRASAEFTSIDRGWYDSHGQHQAASANTLTGFLSSTPGAASYNSFYVFAAGPVRGTRHGRLRLLLDDYLSPDASETVEVYSYDGSTSELVLGHVSDDPVGIGIHGDLQSGTYLGSATVTSGAVGGYIEIPLNTELRSLMSDTPSTVAFGVNLVSRDHADNLALDEAVRFGFSDVVFLQQLEVFFCDPPQPNDLYAIDELGNFFRIDPANSRTDYLSPLGDQSSDLEYNFFNGRLLTFEPGMQELREVDLVSLAQTNSISAPARYAGFDFGPGNQLYASTQQAAPLSTLFILDPSNGQTTPAPVEPLPIRIGGLAFDREAGRFYAIEEDITGRLYRIDTFHDSFTLVGQTNKSFGSLEFGADGTLYAGGTFPDEGKIYSINPNTAQATLLMSSPYGPVSGIAKVLTSPINRRQFGDYDVNYCTGVTDFLTLLDSWQQFYAPVGAPVIGVTDFLALLDNWQTGPGC